MLFCTGTFVSFWGLFTRQPCFKANINNKVQLILTIVFYAIQNMFSLICKNKLFEMLSFFWSNNLTTKSFSLEVLSSKGLRTDFSLVGQLPSHTCDSTFLRTSHRGSPPPAGGVVFTASVSLTRYSRTTSKWDGEHRSAAGSLPRPTACYCKVWL